MIFLEECYDSTIEAPIPVLVIERCAMLQFAKSYR